MEHVAWFNFIYGAITGNDCEAEQAVKYLREWHSLRINWKIEQNSNDSS